MGYRFNNYCYTSENDALGAFLDTYPQTLAIGTSTDIVFLNVSSSSVSSTGLITFSLQDQASNTVVNNATLQLQACDVDKPIMPDFFTVTFAFWFACILGVMAGYAQSKHSMRPE